MKEEIMAKIPRKIRKGTGSLIIALPKEIHDLLELKKLKEVNVVVYSNGKIELQKGAK
jgi:antitoxin component of MazEF toxin-antitoxin module